MINRNSVLSGMQIHGAILINTITDAVEFVIRALKWFVLAMAADKNVGRRRQLDRHMGIHTPLAARCGRTKSVNRILQFGYVVSGISAR